MARRTKRDWLAAGLGILAEQGAGALTIEELTHRLGVTKGSFYHHFADASQYKREFLQFCLEAGTLQIIALVEQAGSPHQKLKRLTEATGHPAPAEVALRAWGLSDPEARRIQAAIDGRRLEYLQALCGSLITDAADARRAALLFYSIYIGSQQILPGLSADEVNDLYLQVRRLFGI